MKKLMMGLSILACAAAFALDNTVDNAFWNTTAYVNATPVTSTATVTCRIDTAAKTEVVTAPAFDFNSRKPGIAVIVR